MTMLKEKELASITGGSSKESLISVVVDYSSDRKFNEDITIKPYLNGELQRDKVRTVDCSITNVTLSFHGKGVANLKVKINNDIIKLYKLDFDKGTYSELL